MDQHGAKNEDENWSCHQALLSYLYLPEQLERHHARSTLEYWQALRRQKRVTLLG